MTNLKLSYERAMVHMMLTYGSVALPPDKREWQDRDRGFSTGGYYHGEIEADDVATVAFAQRLENGARPVYELCGPSDFGQENRFNGTFTDSQLEVHYALMPVVLDDDLENPVKLIAAVEPSHSFQAMLQQLLTTSIDDIEAAVEAMLNRATVTQQYKNQELYELWSKIKYPRLY
jgi:hypothetical protein